MGGTSSNITEAPKYDLISSTQLFPVRDGLIVGEAIKAESLWEKEPVLLHVVRRPGRPLCREEALELSSRFSSGEYSGVKLYGIIKEVAPTANIETDAILGVGEFQRKYFENNPLYLDKERNFFSFLGNRSLLYQPLFSWNPFAIYESLVAIQKRLTAKKVEGNMVGEGIIQGGLLVIVPPDEIIYRHEEVTGHGFPYEEIGEVLKRFKKRDESSGIKNDL